MGVMGALVFAVQMINFTIPATGSSGHLGGDVCRRTIILHNGEITADGPTNKIFQNDKLLSDCCLARPLRMQGCPIYSG